MAGNGTPHTAPPAIGGTPTPAAALPADLQAIYAQQKILIATQGVVVRELEDQLGLSPPPPDIGTIPPPAGSVNLQTVIDAQTGLIRTQAAYTRHLQDLQVALGP